MRRAWALVALWPLVALSPAEAAQQSVAPSVVAWFDATYPTTTPVPPAPPTGVGAGQLLVSGATISTSLLPFTTPAGPFTKTQTTALAALRFTIPVGYTASTFTLVLAPGLSTAAIGGRLPTGVTPLACPVTSAFSSGGQQAFDKAPRYDCSGRTSLGAISADRTSVVFSDIAAVARGKDLSFVVLPGSLGVDRLVFQPPTSTSLSLLSFDAPPVFSSGGAPALPPVAALPLVPPLVAPADPVLAPPAVSPPLPVVTTAPVPPSVALPVAASPAVVRAAVIDDHAVRVKVLGGLALLLAGGVLLALTDRRRSDGQEWGVGRHRAARDGPAPTL